MSTTLTDATLTELLDQVQRNLRATLDSFRQIQAHLIGERWMVTHADQLHDGDEVQTFSDERGWSATRTVAAIEPHSWLPNLLNLRFTDGTGYQVRCDDALRVAVGLS